MHDFHIDYLHLDYGVIEMEKDYVQLTVSCDDLPRARSAVSASGYHQPCHNGTQYLGWYEHPFDTCDNPLPRIALIIIIIISFI